MAKRHAAKASSRWGELVAMATLASPTWIRPSARETELATSRDGVSWTLFGTKPAYLAAALFAVVGHIWPVFYRFRGGFGVSPMRERS